MPDLETAAMALKGALEGVLLALLALGQTKPAKAPSDALDAALGHDEAFSQVRRQLAMALSSGDLLGVEAAANAMVARAADIGWEVAAFVFSHDDKELE